MKEMAAIVSCLLLAAAFLAPGCAKKTESGGPAGAAPAQAGPPGHAAEAGIPADCLLQDMQSGEKASRMDAAERLCHVGKGDAGIVSKIEALMESESPDTREAAAYALG